MTDANREEIDAAIRQLSDEVGDRWAGLDIPEQVVQAMLDAQLTVQAVAAGLNSIENDREKPHQIAAVMTVMAFGFLIGERCERLRDLNRMFEGEPNG